MSVKRPGNNDGIQVGHLGIKSVFRNDFKNRLIVIIIVSVSVFNHIYTVSDRR